jgi:hypothetical protein
VPPAASTRPFARKVWSEQNKAPSLFVSLLPPGISGWVSWPSGLAPPSEGSGTVQVKGLPSSTLDWSFSATLPYYVTSDSSMRSVPSSAFQ